MRYRFGGGRSTGNIFKAWKSYGSFRGEAEEKTWLTRIAINTCKDLTKSAWSRNTDRSVTPENLPEGSAPFDDQDDTVTRAVLALPKDLKEVTLLPLNARKLSEKEMICIGREFIVSNYGLNGEQVARLELYTNTDLPDGEKDNTWYDTVNGKPCFTVEYLLYQPMTAEEYEAGKPLDYKEGDGYYIVQVNVESGEIEEYEYNSGLSGQS